MRIVHVVTYVSEDGAFGGPIAVAVAQLTELARQGHDVELIAGWDGKAILNVTDVQITLFRAHAVMPLGFSGLWAPGLMKAVRSRAKAGAVIHIHLARDLITLGAAITTTSLSALVLQTHGMVMPDNRIAAKILDKIATRPVLSSAKCVLALTDDEAAGLSEVAKGSIRTQMIANGVAKSMTAADDRNQREILFLSRLHPRKRVLYFAQMCQILVERGIDAKFSVVGPDEGDLHDLLAFTKENSLGNYMFYEGPLPSGRGTERLAAAAIYVLPSVGEVFPMTILEALAARTPVVTTRDSGIAPTLEKLEAAVVTDGSPVEMANAVERILNNKDFSSTLVSNGTKALETNFSIEAVSNRLISIYTP